METMNKLQAATKPPTEVLGTKTPCFVFDSNRDLAKHVAQTIAGIIRERASFGKHAVLGLPTGLNTAGRVSRIDSHAQRR